MKRPVVLTKQTVLLSLEEGPVTASELGAILEVPMRNCSAWLGNLRCAGIVEVTGKRSMGARTSNIYALRGARRAEA